MDLKGLIVAFCFANPHKIDATVILGLSLYISLSLSLSVSVSLLQTSVGKKN
jgi:hypothetical protein